MPKTITGAELVPLLEGTRAYVADSMVGFVRAYQFRKAADPGPDDFVADLGGSGTLIQAAGVCAILTADHVLDELPEGFGLILLDRIAGQHHSLIVENASRIHIARGPDTGEGPDLALLILSTVDCAKLEAAGKVFYNLGMRRSRMHTQSPQFNKKTTLILAGMVAEKPWQRDTTPRPGFDRAKHFGGLCGPVVLAASREEGKFDYLSVEVRYDGGYDGPDSYAGCSGGSLWHVPLTNGPAESVVVGEPLLCGVPFYEFAKEKNMRRIECHGPKSIYEAAVQALENLGH